MKVLADFFKKVNKEVNLSVGISEKRLKLYLMIVEKLSTSGTEMGYIASTATK